MTASTPKIVTPVGLSTGETVGDGGGAVVVGGGGGGGAVVSVGGGVAVANEAPHAAQKTLSGVFIVPHSGQVIELNFSPFLLF